MSTLVPLLVLGIRLTAILNWAAPGEQAGVKAETLVEAYVSCIS